MAEYDRDMVWNYVDPETIAEDLIDGMMVSVISDEEAELASAVISEHRLSFVAQSVHRELKKRRRISEHMLDRLDNSDVLDLYDLAPDSDYWWAASQDIRSFIAEDGRFVNFEDFMLAHRQVHTTREYITNLFHTLVLFFVEDDPEKHAETQSLLRYRQQNQSWSNEFSPTHRFFLRAETLIPYAAEKVKAEDKIPGVGRKGRRIIRAILYDEQDIEVLMAQERDRLTPPQRHLTIVK